MRRGRSLGILLCFGLFLPALAASQPATMLLDISTGSGEPEPGSSFYSLRKAGDRLYFVHEGGTSGAELWVSDGTSTGTEVLRDLCPGSCGGVRYLFGGLGKVMLWSSGLSSEQSQLWRSDGTRPGTFALTDEDIGMLESPPDQPGRLQAFLGRSFYFVGCSTEGGAQDCNLWQTDGSVAGTRLLQEVPGSFLWLSVAGSRLFFATIDDDGSSLWVTDGTAAGTAALHRFEGQSVRPAAPAAAGGRLFFLGGDHGEVWTSDGTAAGTRAATQLAPAQPVGRGSWLLPSGDRVWFVASDGSHGREIWRTDGTASGTVRATDFKLDQPFRLDDSSFLAALDGTLVFLADDGQTPSRLWTTRGTPQTTAPLPCDDCRIDATLGLTVSGGKVFVPVNHSDRTSLWITDGTAAGTRRLKELCDFCDVTINPVVPWNGGVLFLPHADIWFSDGTSAGTGRFTNLTGAVASLTEMAELAGDLYFFSDWSFPPRGMWVRDKAGKTRPVLVTPVPGASSRPERLTSLGGKLVFNAAGDLWSSAGTAETTLRADLPQAIAWKDARDFVSVGGLLFFQVGGIFSENDLWRTDGTAQGTVLLAHLPESAVLVPYQGALRFFSDGGIWRSDGTMAGTVRTGDLPGEVTQASAAVAGTNGIYVSLQIDYQDGGLWLTDGTTAGTRPFLEPPGNGLGGLTVVGPWMYFVLDSELWQTDGTPEGTSMIQGLPNPPNPDGLLSYQGILFFFTRTSGDNLRLWRLDGAAALPIARFPYRPSYEPAPVLTPFGGKLYFRVDDGEHGLELWATDGTPAGTGLVLDLFPGLRSSSPGPLTVAGGRLFFTVGENLHGIELWQSDGTAAGTHLVQDIAPQAESSSPEQLTPVGDKLFFTADDGVTGREVWVLPLSGPFSCQPSPTRLCLGGRYAVEAVWRDFQANRGVGHAAPLTADTGTFWFFNPENVEVVLKVLDGRGLNDHVWVFYGALSNVEYTLTVTDTQTGLSHRYINPSGQLASVADTKAFGPLGATAESVASASPLPLVERKTGPATAVCAPSSTRLCLNGDRFAVEVAWKDFQGKTGVGKAVEMTGDTGYFWFFNESNVEVVLKVLDGRPVNGHHWVFYGALSSVEYTVTVTDTQTGEINTYKNPSGRLASVADTGAF